MGLDSWSRVTFGEWSSAPLRINRTPPRALFALVLHLAQHLIEPVHAADRGERLLDQRVPDILLEIAPHGVVPDFLGVFPAQAQILQRAVQLAAAGGGADHVGFSATASTGAG